MRKKIEWQWEILDNIASGDNQTVTARAKVIGGWLVHHTFHKKNCLSESMTFIPDRDHEWYILPPIQIEKSEPVDKSNDFNPK